MAAVPRILVVEDEAIEALDIQQRLERMGYQVSGVAHSGEEGLRKAEELSPDLVLMDIMLPGKLDGVMTAERIRSRLDIPVIYLTAYADENTLQRAKITEPYAYLVKPFQERELHIAIEIALYKYKIERKLKESEKWFSTTLRSIGDAVIATDRNALVKFMNPVAESLTGWPQEEALEMHLAKVFDIINRDTRQTVENPVIRVLREGNIVGLANHTVLVTRNGTEIPIDDRASPIKDDRGNLIGVVLVFRDVTEREKAERVKDEFIGMVSHEIRTPLTLISGSLQTAMTEGIAPEDKQELMLNAVEGTISLTAIVENLLELSRHQAGRLQLKIEPVSIPATAENVILQLKARGTRQQFKKDFPAGLPEVKGDAMRVERILYNLLENAVKYSPEEGEIIVGARSEGGLVIIGVTDRGKGISPSDQDRLFQHFERLEQDLHFLQGLGLGLVVCKHLVEAQQGRIWVESEVGKGSTFYFTLPVDVTKRKLSLR